MAEVRGVIVDNGNEKWYEDTAVRFLIGVLIGGIIGIIVGHCIGNSINLASIANNDRSTSETNIDFSDKFLNDHLVGWDTSRATDMSWAFAGCSEVDEDDLERFDATSAKELSELFAPTDPDDVQWPLKYGGR